jgi:hypothetical protein
MMGGVSAAAGGRADIEAPSKPSEVAPNDEPAPRLDMPDCPKTFINTADIKINLITENAIFDLIFFL